MSTYRISALKMGETTVPRAELYWMTHLTGWERIAFWAFLIETADRRILLNTGFPEDFSALHQHWTAWARAATGEEGHVPLVEQENLIEKALEVRGLKTDQIDDILLTPLTAYATGCLDRFSKAKIWISRRGWIDFHAPDPEIPQLPRHIIFPPHVLQYLVGEAADRIRLVPDEETEILPGIRAWFCGAHHRSSLVFLVQTSKGKVALTDAVFTYRNYEERIPLGLSESLEEHYRLFARLERRADVVVPLYDPLLIERHPDGIIA